ncbi:hypothetical protein J7643_03110 [bacterium]|nr:hypothetical protein [bacterium]
MKKVIERKDQPVLGGEAAFRHGAENQVDQLELDPNQTTPVVLRDTDETQLEVLEFREPTPGHSIEPSHDNRITSEE